MDKKKPFKNILEGDEACLSTCLGANGFKQRNCDMNL